MSTQRISKSLIAQAGNQLDGFKEAVAKIREYQESLERSNSSQGRTMMLQSSRRSKESRQS